MKKISLIVATLLLGACSEIHQVQTKTIDTVTGIQDPTERGLSYIAIAIIVSAVIRGLINK